MFSVTIRPNFNLRINTAPMHCTSFIEHLHKARRLPAPGTVAVFASKIRNRDAGSQSVNAVSWEAGSPWQTQSWNGRRRTLQIYHSTGGRGLGKSHEIHAPRTPNVHDTYLYNSRSPSISVIRWHNWMTLWAFRRFWMEFGNARDERMEKWGWRTNGKCIRNVGAWALCVHCAKDFLVKHFRMATIAQRVPCTAQKKSGPQTEWENLRRNTLPLQRYRKYAQTVYPA